MWVTMLGNKTVPVNPEPSPQGTIAIAPNPAASGKRYAIVVADLDGPVDCDLYRPHRETCVDGTIWGVHGTRKSVFG